MNSRSTRIVINYVSIGFLVLALVAFFMPLATYESTGPRSAFDLLVQLPSLASEMTHSGEGGMTSLVFVGMYGVCLLAYFVLTLACIVLYAKNSEGLGAGIIQALLSVAVLLGYVVFMNVVVPAASQSGNASLIASFSGSYATLGVGGVLMMVTSAVSLTFHMVAVRHFPLYEYGEDDLGYEARHGYYEHRRGGYPSAVDYGYGQPVGGHAGYAQGGYYQPQPQAQPCPQPYVYGQSGYYQPQPQVYPAYQQPVAYGSPVAGGYAAYPAAQSCQQMPQAYGNAPVMPQVAPMPGGYPAAAPMPCAVDPCAPQGAYFGYPGAASQAAAAPYPQTMTQQPVAQPAQAVAPVGSGFAPQNPQAAAVPVQQRFNIPTIVVPVQDPSKQYQAISRTTFAAMAASEDPFEGVDPFATGQFAPVPEAQIAMAAPTAQEQASMRSQIRAHRGGVAASPATTQQAGEPPTASGLTPDAERALAALGLDQTRTFRAVVNGPSPSVQEMINEALGSTQSFIPVDAGDYPYYDRG